MTTPDGGPLPPRAVVDRTQSWLAVALVAAAVVLMAVVSDAATVPPLGLAQRPVVTTVITLSAVPDPRATGGPAPTRPAAGGVMVKQERLARGPRANDTRSGIGATTAPDKGDKAARIASATTVTFWPSGRDREPPTSGFRLATGQGRHRLRAGR